MKEVLDNLFGKKNATTNEGENLEQTEVVVEPVSERENYPEPIHTEINDEVLEVVVPVETPIEIVQDVVEEITKIENEPKSEEVNNDTEDCIICEIKKILSESHGLDYELVELRKNIANVLNKYEAHCKSKN